MYYIRKYSNCWAIHDDVINTSRKLNAEEIEKLKNEFPSLKDDKVLTVYSDRIRSITFFTNTYQENENKIPNP